MTVPGLSAPPPSRKQPEEDFDDNVASFIADLVVIIPGMNTAVDLINVDRLAAESAAADAAASANTAALAAEALNYQGPWNALTNYTTGQSTSHQSFLAIAKRANTGVEPVDGDDWFILRRPVETQEFLVSGTWPKPSGISYVAVEVIAAGASGGSTTGSGTVAKGGGGGGSTRKLYRADELPENVDIIVGTGGNRVHSGAPGNPGGNSQFGDLIAYGGGNAPGSTDPARGGGFTAAGSGGENSGGGSIAAVPGGACTYGGAGGGSSQGTGGAQFGGVSLLGGDGGAASDDNSDTYAVDGAVPGGGGGGRSQSFNSDRRSGKGGGGMVSIAAW